jgi:flagellar basal-body rod modification protein FlgD
MASSVNPLTSPTANTPNSSSNALSSVTGTQQIGENTFLQLLVAQLQNQDPTQPMDGMQFVTQLAQFSQLESTYAIQSDTDKLVVDAGGSTSNSGTNPTTPTTGS